MNPPAREKSPRWARAAFPYEDKKTDLAVRMAERVAQSPWPAACIASSGSFRPRGGVASAAANHLLPCGHRV
jgi:hypothetical protein